MNTSAPSLSHVLREAQLDASLIDLFEIIAASAQRIAHRVARGALSGVLGCAGSENVQGETQKKLDVIANDLLLNALAESAVIAGIASEELDDASPVAGQEHAPYLITFDPLDGSSNIDVNVSIGTIFSLLPNPQAGQTNASVTNTSFLQPGTAQIAAGYVVYGPQTQLVLSWGQGVMGFTLDSDCGQFLLTTAKYNIPREAKEYAINASNAMHWEAPVQRYIEELNQGSAGPRGRSFNMRWIASMVADVHRVMTRGGVFMYPRDARDPSKPGKLRLLYEANPMSYLIEQAGGLGFDGQQSILSIQPSSLHQRCSVMLGARDEIERLMSYHSATRQAA